MYITGVRKYIRHGHALNAENVRIINRGVIAVRFKDGSENYYFNNTYNGKILRSCKVRLVDK